MPLAFGLLSEGALCSGFETLEDAQLRDEGVCAEGLGCFQDGFLARCLRFCQSSAIDKNAACAGSIDESYAHTFGETSACSLRIFDRTEIGACRLSCEFGGSGLSAGCPEGTTCGLTPDLYEARCLPEGLGQEGADCNLNCPCASGLVCVPEVSADRCREPVPTLGCGDSAFRQRISGTRNPFQSTDDNWVSYNYCPKCVRLSISRADKPLWLCATDSCEASDVLADLSTFEQSTLLASISEWLGTEFSLVVGLSETDVGWVWASAPNTPVSVQGASGTCATLTSSSMYNITSDCEGFRICETRSAGGCHQDQ